MQQFDNEPLTAPVIIPSHKSLVMKGNQNASKGFPSKPNHDRYPVDGFPLICDRCFVREKCDKYEAGATCAYRREFDGLSSRDAEAAIEEIEALVQVQAARVTMGVIHEQLTGGVSKRQTGREIDRQRRMLETLGKLRAEQASVPQGLNPDGIMARLFVGDGLEPPPAPWDNRRNGAGFKF